eukprot:CAMPEP_0202973960 /NCGR_PEP_ID=MMETSP1396-20130829/55896_1 /ASSEMBLY_ACC=CAM_ASM_000872 /TAXON_ID= /ORGANISM="Pseudokeronopsis sp., Strain Brazil" /LENGTH=48 /DNA_ID= /DNA_START= /DNA_END= /DNA_ORIENTATION=
MEELKASEPKASLDRVKHFSKNSKSLSAKEIASSKKVTTGWNSDGEED